ncbi:hypothetical protein VP1G_10884 [Cytospora mali]|uniref:Uncharacterized protein n=1 Tax=Cytospora mali TaxID=578113 RepID=A0A194UYF9_CYTMA|nr:hypothetical protein VP1G_10884 [Valsa mali var. pyri (nom. inval.)]
MSGSTTLKLLFGSQVARLKVIWSCNERIGQNGDSILWYASVSQIVVRQFRPQSDDRAASERGGIGQKVMAVDLR